MAAALGWDKMYQKKPKTYCPLLDCGFALLCLVANLLFFILVFCGPRQKRTNKDKHKDGTDPPFTHWKRTSLECCHLRIPHSMLFEVSCLLFGVLVGCRSSQTCPAPGVMVHWWLLMPTMWRRCLLLQALVPLWSTGWATTTFVSPKHCTQRSSSTQLPSQEHMGETNP